jgi:hypothetical protein
MIINFSKIDSCLFRYLSQKIYLAPAEFYGTKPDTKSQEVIKVVTAVRIHLFPSRTEKLSSPTPMVLLHQVGE